MTIKRKVKSDLDNDDIVFDDMKCFLRNFGKHRLNLLNCLIQTGPASCQELVCRLRRKKVNVISDIAYLTENGLIDTYSKGLFFVSLRGIVVTVQHHNYEPHRNVKNIVDLYLFSCVKKYSWLQVNVKLRIIQRGSPRFSCSLTPVF
jgi:hypothetical protein